MRVFADLQVDRKLSDIAALAIDKWMGHAFTIRRLRAELLDEHWDTGSLALLYDLADVANDGRPSFGARFTADDNPINDAMDGAVRRADAMAKLTQLNRPD